MTEPRPGLAPEPPPFEHSEVLTVDGHDFRVGRRGATYDVDWLTGPHPYGFGLTRPAGTPMSRAELEQAIRDFLAGINPETGYLD